MDQYISDYPKVSIIPISSCNNLYSPALQLSCKQTSSGEKLLMISSGLNRRSSSAPRGIIKETVI